MARSRAQTRPVTLCGVHHVPHGRRPPWASPDRAPQGGPCLPRASGPRQRRGVAGRLFRGPRAGPLPAGTRSRQRHPWQSPVATDVLLTDDGSSPPHSPRRNVLPPQFPAKLPHWGPPPRRPLSPAPPSHGARSRRLRGRGVLCRPLRGPSEGTAASLLPPRRGRRRLAVALPLVTVVAVGDLPGTPNPGCRGAHALCPAPAGSRRSRLARPRP